MTKFAQSDPKLTGEEPEFQAAVFLLQAANQESLNADFIAADTGIPRRLCRQWGRHLRDSGVFTPNHRIAHSGWFDEDGGFAFWLDVSVALGYMDTGYADLWQSA